LTGVYSSPMYRDLFWIGVLAAIMALIVFVMALQVLR
jgi:hypothetical protein